MENSFPDRVEHKSRQVNKTTEAVSNDDARPSQQLGKKNRENVNGASECR